MKTIVGPLLVLGLLLAFLGALVFSPQGTNELADYERLWRARDGLPGTLGDVEALAWREDGVGWQARILAARWHVSQGSFEAAASHLKIALALRATADLRKELALSLEGAGRKEEALKEWEKLLPGGEAVQAVRRLEPDPVRAASLLTKGGAPGEALDLLRTASGAQATLERARALLALGRNKEAIPEFERYLAARPQDATVRVDYGRALERAGEREKALAAYHAAGPTGGYLGGLLLESLGRIEEAIGAYGLSSEPEARWRAARLLEGQGRETEALALYRELASGTHRVRDDAALRAYLIYSRRGDASQAAAMAKLFPPAFQWILGTYRPPPVTNAVPDPAVALPRAVRVAGALLQALPGSEGQAWARAELDLALRKASPQEKIAIGEWYLEQGDYNAAFRIGSSASRDLPCRRAYALAYPLAYEAIVRKWAAAYGVDPFLVLAVMREESAYIPKAVSSSDARGLMQLLPSTAKWIAEDKLKVPYREAALFNPELNIQLGTWYLGYLLREFGGDVAKAVAAYNGGPGNLRRWTAGGVSTTDLPGALQYIETREYLVKVLNSWLTYRWLYSGNGR